MSTQAAAECSRALDMLCDAAAAKVVGGVTAQLKMQRSRARMQADELMVKHYEEIGRDLQWVVRGGRDQSQKDAAVAMLQKLRNAEEFQRRETEAGTSAADMLRKIVMFHDYCSQGSEEASGVNLRAELERVMRELQSSCPTVIQLRGDSAGDASCRLDCRSALARQGALTHPQQTCCRPPTSKDSR
jgi:hypothetical protein